MRTIYQSGINSIEKKRKRIYIAALIFLISILAIAEWTFVGDKLSEIFHTLFKPLIKAEISILDTATPVSFYSKQELAEENMRLKNVLREAEVSLAELKSLREENMKLKAALGRPEEENLLLAVVLAKPNRSPYDTVLVDVGSSSGLQKGMLALAYEMVPIGRVEEVREKTSLIRLFSSPGQTSYVEIGENKIPATAEGRGGGNFLVLLPKDTSVSLSDEVTLPSMTPRTIGIVEKIEENETETFARIFFKSIVNVYDISKVFIITDRNYDPL